VDNTDPKVAGSHRLSAILEKAKSGDQSVLPSLRQALDDPALAETFGNVSRRVEATLIGRLAGKDLAVREATACRLETMRRELAGDNSTPLERQLADRVALCWLALHDAELRFALAKDLSISQCDYWQRRIDHLHRRYLSAVKALATVRRLAVPVLIGQVNFASQQVNQIGLPASDLGAQRGKRLH
jgi:hypothetical protein